MHPKVFQKGKKARKRPKVPKLSKVSKRVQICEICSKLSRGVQNTKKGPKSKKINVSFFLGDPVQLLSHLQWVESQVG